jgi:hypothetical protein
MHKYTRKCHVWNSKMLSVATKIKTSGQSKINWITSKIETIGILKIYSRQYVPRICLFKYWCELHNVRMILMTDSSAVISSYWPYDRSVTGAQSLTVKRDKILIKRIWYSNMAPSLQLNVNFNFLMLRAMLYIKKAIFIGKFENSVILFKQKRYTKSSLKFSPLLNRRMNIYWISTALINSLFFLKGYFLNGLFTCIKVCSFKGPLKAHNAP